MIRILIFTLAGMLVHSFAESGPFSTPGPQSGPRIKLDTMADSDPVHPGDRFKLYLSVQIEEGWHIYSLQPLDGNEFRMMHKQNWSRPISISQSFIRIFTSLKILTREAIP